MKNVIGWSTGTKYTSNTTGSGELGTVKIQPSGIIREFRPQLENLAN